MNVFKLAFASFKRKKSSSIVFLVMCVIAAFILSTGLSLQMGTKGFYDKKIDELNTPHYTNFIFEAVYKSEHLEFAREYESVTDVDIVDGLFAIGTWDMKKGVKREMTVIMLPEQSLRETFYSPPTVDKLATRPADPITLPMSFKTAGFRSGQQITVDVNSIKYTFTIYGFYEDAIAGSSTWGMDLIIIDNAKFSDLKTGGNFVPAKNLMIRFEKPRTATKFESEFSRKFNIPPNENFVAEYETSEMAASMFTNMMAMIMMIFAVIILLIAFIVVMFSIRSSITEEIKSIGVLKAVGYGDNKLRGIQIIKYLCIAVVGTVLGAIGGIFFFKIIGNIIASTSGLLWLSGTNFLPTILSIVIITALTAFISWFFTLKYKKITPVSALRNTSTAKIRGGSILPLSKTALPLDIHMGTKRFISSVTSNISLFVIISMLVFISVLVNVMNYNLNTDRTAMIEMVGMEMAEVYAQIADSSVSMEDFDTEILKDERVVRTLLNGDRIAFIGDTQIFVETMDYTKLNKSTIVSGRYPTADDEIALLATTAKTANKKVGSTVDIELNGIKRTYKVVGISQAIGNSTSKITIDAMRVHEPAFAYSVLFIYLKPGTDANAFISDWKSSQIAMINTEEQMGAILNSLGDPVKLLTSIMMVLNVIIVAFVLYLMISTIIRKTKQEFGILKALGFTNNRLIVQLLLSLLPALVIGTCVGILLGFTLSNPILSLFFGSVGLLKTYFIIPTFASILIALSIFGTGVVATYVISLRLKQISPQKLITAV